MGGLIAINKLIFGTSKEADEFVTFAKSKGYNVSKPVREKRAQNSRKAYDINGKPVKFQWKVIMGVRGVGKKGGKKDDEDREKIERIVERIRREAKQPTKEDKETFDNPPDDTEDTQENRMWDKLKLKGS